MVPEIKAEWIRRLRSGQYNQGKGALRRKRRTQEKDEYCCLGVLCEIAVEAGVVQRFLKRELIPGAEKFAYGLSEEDQRTAFLPLEVQIWAGLNGTNPAIRRTSPRYPHIRARFLSDLNDQGTSFAEIADLIDASL